ncbi:MAG: outer membrane beta-barrel domain-containing protein [Gammaproteobacteria bacterium]|nr:outer membrane beta-barrel domain-containing protein [Gammaproteobacteria bacterium]
MESRIRIFLLRSAAAVLVLVTVAGCASRGLEEEAAADQARPVIDPQVERRDVAPPDIDTEDFEVGASFGFMSIEDFGSNSAWGLRLAYHVSEGLFAEATYGQTDAGKTSYENLSGSQAPLLSNDDREYSWYDLSLGWNLLPGEVFIGRNHAFNSALYVVIGAGNTSFASDDFFTFVYGAGYRVLATDSIALHFDVRDHMFDIDITGEDKTTHNIEFNLGATWFF